MRIAICARTWGDKGGVGVYTRNLLKAMLPMNSGHQYTVFYTNKAYVGSFSGCENVKEVFVPAYGKLMWDQLAVPYYAAKEKVDIVFHLKFSVPLLAKCKTVTVLHGTEAFVHPELRRTSDRLFWAYRILVPLSLRRATGIICVSNNVKKDMISLLNIDPEKVKTVHLASANHFKEIDDHVFLASVRNKYNLPERFILNVGLAYPGKNISNLLKALKLLQQIEPIKLVLAGGDRWLSGVSPSPENTFNMVRQLGLQHEVLLPGYIPHEDLVAVYNLADVFILPSVYEGFGIPVIEAMACGCPVIASKTGALPEICGDAAYYIDASEPDEMAEAIRKVLVEGGLREELVKKGVNRAREFSWEKCARETLEVLESINGG